MSVYDYVFHLYSWIPEPFNSLVLGVVVLGVCVGFVDLVRYIWSFFGH